MYKIQYLRAFMRNEKENCVLAANTNEFHNLTDVIQLAREKGRDRENGQIERERKEKESKGKQADNEKLHTDIIQQKRL